MIILIEDLTDIKVSFEINLPFKDILDQEFGPDWQVIVGKKGSFGSCLSPMAGHYINFSIDGVTFLIFRAN